MISSTGAGIAITSIQRKKYDISCDIIRLCDELILDLEYRVTPINILLKRCLENKQNLAFISSNVLTENTTIKSVLNSSENAIISSFLCQLGKSDVATQIKLIRGFKEEFNQVKSKYFEQYNRYKKVNLSFGIFVGITICILIA